MIGFLNVYKPKGITSNAVLSKIKKQFGVKKLGHMGTLDPMAEGVLPIACGNATKMFDYFLNKQKIYIATFEFGYETDTLDAFGETIKTSNVIPNFEDVKKTISSFVGKINQIPPKYSAKNVNGKRAYDLARQNVDFDLTAKEVEIFDYELLNYNQNSFEFKIVCSSGTYIRSLCRDLAYKLNTFATMTRLIRSESGKFNLQNAVQLEDLLNSNLEKHLIDVTNVFDYKIVCIDEIEYKKLINGMIINFAFDNGYVFVKHKNQNLGVGIVFESKLKLKTHF